jgi:hypothetical protein
LSGRGLDGYIPSREWFLADPFGVHGVGHAARVLVWANAIANSLNRDGHRVDLPVVRWAAVLHDTRRESDGVDEGHGRRAAAWVRRRCAQGLDTLADDQVDAVAYCVQWHVPADGHAPLLTAELACLKDADSLDRVRFGMLDARYLRTPPARVLVPVATALFKDSQRRGRPASWDQVRAAAESLGLWSEDAHVPDIGRDGRRHRCATC